MGINVTINDYNRMSLLYTFEYQLFHLNFLGPDKITPKVQKKQKTS